MKIYKLAAFFALLSASANAAVWERPAGAYTPTNNSVNITKYQTDSANHVAISSVKVDGDINKAFQGLNDIEARTAPTVAGQSGKFLTNNGAASMWGLIPPTSISSTGITAGYVIRANGIGSTTFGLLDTTSFPDFGVAGTYVGQAMQLNSAGQVISVTAPAVMSETNVYISNSLFVSGTATVSGSLTVIGSISATNLGMVKLGTFSVSSQTSLTVTGISGFSSYKIIGWMKPVTDNVDLNMALSADGGGSYLNSGYGWRSTDFTTEVHNFSDSKFQIDRDAVGNDTGEQISFELNLLNPSSAQYKGVSWTGDNNINNGTMSPLAGGGGLNNTSVINAASFTFSSGNVSLGQLTLYGLR